MATSTRELALSDQFIIPLDAPRPTDAERVGPKAANLAALGACRPADAGRLLSDAPMPIGGRSRRSGSTAWSASFAAARSGEQRRLSVEIRLGLYEQPIAPEILEPLLAAWRAQRDDQPARRRGALLRADRGSRRRQFRRPVRELPRHRRRSRVPHRRARLLGRAVDHAMRAATWTTTRLDPADTAMAVLIQPLVARARLRRRPERDRRGTDAGQRDLGARLRDRAGRGGARSHRAQSRQGFLRKIDAGRKDHRDDLRPWRRRPAAGGAERARARSRASTPGRRSTLGRLMRKAEAVIGGPVEIEWALDDAGLQAAAGAAAARSSRSHVPDEIWLQHPGLNGHPAGIGWGAGRAVVVNCECELSRVAPGDVLVTRVAGPALSHILPRVAGVVAELGGSTSHLASLARERGIPMVLGVLDATQPHPRRRAGRGRRRRRHRAMDRLMRAKPLAAHLRHPADRQERARAPAQGRRPSRSIRIRSRIIAKQALDRRRADVRHPVLPAARPHRSRRDRGQSEAARWSRRNPSRPRISTWPRRPRAAFP